VRPTRHSPVAGAVGTVIATPDRRVRVFVSSTLEELAEERAAARSAIEELRLTPVLFELGARPHPPRELYRSYLEQSDVFVGIYGERYGWIAPGEEISGLEDELRLAAGKPRLLYVKRPAPAREDRLVALIARIEADGAVSYRSFRDAAELGQLLADDLALLLSERFQPPAAARTPRIRARLPAPVDRFVGREAELKELERQLRSRATRLLTVTGPGGVGKTRLALEAASRTRDAFRDGAHFVSLSAVTDPALVASAIQSSLELPGSPRDPVEGVLDVLRDAELLLLLDNYEQLLAAAPVAARLLEECPRLSLLVTSRAVLKLRGERELEVLPLQLPEAAATADEVRHADAVALFVERARAVRPHFALEDSNRAEVVAICRDLDGLPLALELAAAQLRLLSPQHVLRRLEDRLSLASRGAHAYPGRQQTLRNTIEWSYALLSADEQAVFARAGVFSGGWTLEAFGAVCGADALEALASLVEHSLVASDGAAEPRFAMLPTIRAYAVERLADAPEADDVRRRHAGYYRALAIEANLESVRLGAGGRFGAMRLDLVRPEADNLRAALAWSLETGEIALGLGLATALEGFWITGDPREGMRWFRSLLAHPRADAVPPGIRARALLAFGSTAHLSGDVDLARSLYDRSLALAGDADGADRRLRAVLLYRLGITAMQRGEHEAARELVEQSLAIQVEVGDRWGETQSVGALGAIAREEGDADRARERLEASVALAREIGARWWEGGMLGELAALAVAGGRVDEAEERALESLVIAEEIRDRPGHVFGVGLLAAVAAERGRPERARLLLAAVEEEDAFSPLGGWQRHRGLCTARVRSVLGDRGGGAGGRKLPLADAVRLALDGSGGAGEEPAP
jgi:predicted ATPase